MEIKMADQQQPQTDGSHPTCMESVNRIAKLPMVESTLETATNIYGKVKDFNGITNWTLSTAENTVNKVVEVGKPLAESVVQKLDGPIKKVDGALCTGLDYVESKVPAVKLPPGEILFQIYTTTKDYVNNTVTPAVESAYKVVEPAVNVAHSVVDPAVQAAKHVVDPAVQAAKHVVDPVVDKAMKIAEPVVQPAREKVQALKDYGTQKVEEFLHRRPSQESNIECHDCKEENNKQ